MAVPCTVSGTLQTITSGKIAQGRVIFQLTNIGTGNPIGVSGTSIIPALSYTTMTAQDGTFSLQLWGNDNINPANTLYAVTYRDFAGNEMGPILYNIVGASANMNSLSAASGTVPPIFSPTIATIAAFNSGAQAVGIGITTLYATPSSTPPAGAGLYRLSYYLYVVIPGNAVNLTGTFGWTDDSGAGANSLTTANISCAVDGANSTSALGLGQITFQAKASSNITYATSLSGAIGAGAYVLRLRLEYLG